VQQLLRLAPVERDLGKKAAARWVAAQAECYDRAIGCCAASRWAAESIIEDYGVDARRVHVVGIGRNHSPRHVPRDWSRPRFLFVGLEWERKNGEMVVRAFTRLRELVPEAKLDLVGDHPTVDIGGVVAHGRLRLAEPRHRERVRTLFESATCLVMPSRYEPFGMAYVEAAAAGVPFIGTVVGGAADLAEAGGGVLVDPSDEEALFRAMVVLSNPARAMAMGAAALRGSAWFTWPSVAQRILRVLGTDSDALA
jgi:glycosyltransferase involved in cell wall biosynthesis